MIKKKLFKIKKMMTKSLKRLIRIRNNNVSFLILITIKIIPLLYIIK